MQLFKKQRLSHSLKSEEKEMNRSEIMTALNTSSDTYPVPASITKPICWCRFVVMKVLPEPTASKLQEAAEHLSVSPKQLSILSIEEKLAQLEDEFRRSAE